MTVIEINDQDQEEVVSEPDEIETIDHHPIVEQIVDMLCTKTQNNDRSFFRIEVAYFLAKMASSMRAKLFTKDRGEIPINIYAMALAVSGVGKGFSIGLLENEYLSGFRQRFMEETFPVISEQFLWEAALKRAARNGTDDQEEFEKVEKEFKSKGALPFTFDSGTAPAVKQLREKLLLGKIGSINFQVDEFGSNLESSGEIMDVFFELYDKGEVKNKLIKNTNDNKRSEEIVGCTPANALFFGTPTKLFDGGRIEDMFYSYLAAGYGRRCLFAVGHRQRTSEDKSAAEIYADLIKPTNRKAVEAIYHHFINLADPAKYEWTIAVEDEVAIRLLQYKIDCEKLADAMPEHEDIRKTEMTHRYFKALKLAGTYAFIDEELELSMDNLLRAIKLVEESGVALHQILNREKPYVKLAKFLAAVGQEQTHADLHEALPFYKSGSGARNEMMTLATAWGYRQHIMVRKTFVDGIEFFKGETLEETDLEKLKVSYSDHFAYKYLNEEISFENLPHLLSYEGMHWCNHFFKNNHRSEENTHQGFNMVVLDIDGGTPLFQVHELLKEYKFITQTTKRHADDEHRFRLILPINYNLKLDAEEYSQFMLNILNWLPFKVDESANQRSRKWATNVNAQIHTNEGMLLDALLFVPKTQKNEQYLQQYQNIESLDNLERWFAQRIAAGNRNNQMLKFAMALFDSGYDFATIESKVLKFNNQLSNKLPEDELRSTVLFSVGKKFKY